MKIRDIMNFKKYIKAYRVSIFGHPVLFIPC